MPATGMDTCSMKANRPKCTMKQARSVRMFRAKYTKKKKTKTIFCFQHRNIKDQN